MGILFVFPTWFVAQRLSLRLALEWVLLLMLMPVYTADCIPLKDRVLLSLIYGSLEAFSAIVSYIAQCEMQAREELTRTNAELMATQDLLASQTRLAERIRVARELHDVLGHRLAALSLHLEAAAHSDEEAARAAVKQAQEQTRSLLTDVRGVVSTMRKEEPIDLESALSALTEDIGCPRIHLELRGEAPLDDPARAHALVRCVQEIITNTLKHASAKNLWIEVESHPEGLLLRARDDGQGVAKVVEGHGLRGMRERLNPFGGRLDLASNPGEFRVNVWIPAFSGGAA
jgi:signal transduction histidine kinase